MRRSIVALALIGTLLGSFLLLGCSPAGNDAAPAQKVIEHTTSTPPPGIVESQKQQSQTARQSEKAPPPR